MMAPFAWAALSSQAPTPRQGGAPPSRRDGLDGECARQSDNRRANDAASPDYAAAYRYRFRHALQRAGSGTGSATPTSRSS